MTLLAYIVVALNAVICVRLFFEKSRRRSPFQFFYLSLLSLVILPGFSDINAGYHSFHPFAPPVNLTSELIVSAHLKVLMMMLSFLFLEKIASLYMAPPVFHFPPVRVGWNVYDAIIILLVFYVASGIWYYGFFTLSSASLEDIRVGRIGAFPLYLFYFQIILAGIPAFYLLRLDRRLTGAFVFILFVAIYLFLGGSRQAIVISIAVAIAIVLGRSGRWNAVLLIVVFTVGFAAIDFVLQILKMLRNLPSLDHRLSFISALLSGEISFSAPARDSGSESSIRYVMYDFLYYNPPPDFGSLSYLRRALLFWLPSSVDVLGIKPPDFEVVMFAEAMGNRVGTMHATFFGSAFADARFFSFLWVILFVILFRLIEHVIPRLGSVERCAVWGSSVYVAFMVARGSLYAPLVVISIAIAIAVLSTRLRVGKEVSGYTLAS